MAEEVSRTVDWLPAGALKVPLGIQMHPGAAHTHHAHAYLRRRVPASVEASGECTSRVLWTSARLSSLSASTCTRPQALGAALCGRQRLFSPASSCSPATGRPNCRGGGVPAGALTSSSSAAAPASAASWRLVRCASVRAAKSHGHPCGMHPGARSLTRARAAQHSRHTRGLP